MWKTLIIMALTFLLVTSSHLCAEEINGYKVRSGVVEGVVQTENYTYLFLREGIDNNWLAVPRTDSIKLHDKVSFPDGEPILEMSSKSLKVTFEKIWFSPGVRIENNEH